MTEQGGADAELALERRDGLPEALRVLLEAFPRLTWQAHPGFDDLISFWLDRHRMFRDLAQVLRSDAEAAADGALAPQAHAARLSRFGGMLVGNLHQHHQIEDVHYFPRMVGMEAPLARGFAILDRDHHAMDGLLARLTEAANGVLRGQTEAGVFAEDAAGFEALLLRHLEDEEDLVVPVLLKHGTKGF